MSELEYLRPETLEEALRYLSEGIPLAGGTSITPRRRDFQTVVDLQNLGLDQVLIDDPHLTLGATTKLQQIVDFQGAIPEPLREVCRLEGGWNLRNMMTIGGAIMTADARSPLLTVLLTLDAEVIIEPGGELLPLDDLLDERSRAVLLTEVRCQLPDKALYHQVSRSPKDFPLLCACVARYLSTGAWRLAIGGYGERPIRLREAEEALREGSTVEDVAEIAEAAYARAGDAWASAAYRSSIAGVVFRRLLQEAAG
jgi:probable selenate reductase FAD-binding subunit